MKILFAALLISTSFNVFACPNFTGEFVSAEFGTYYSISQEGCEVIQFHYDEGIVDAPLDGKEYLINDYDIVVEEGKVLAHVKVFSTHSLQKNKLITKERSETTYTSGGIDTDQGWSESNLDKKNNLVIIVHGSSGKETHIDLRVK